MNKKRQIGAGIAGAIWLLGIVIWYLHRSNFAVLNPAGTIAARERTLLALTFVIGIVIITVVYILTFLIVWRYRENSKTRGKYQPEMSSNLLAELTWWGIPTLLIIFLSVLTWRTSHTLDPRIALTSARQPLQVQVVALDWKWLFIYPNQGVASVNFLELPRDQPIHFSVTADAPMNSFWIPQLGGQIYAMPGMSTQLNLLATRTGDYRGESANISGKGFADMHFITHVVPTSEFTHWLEITRRQTTSLDTPAYKQLILPGTIPHPYQYGRVASNLFGSVVDAYMTPGGGKN